MNDQSVGPDPATPAKTDPKSKILSSRRRTRADKLSGLLIGVGALVALVVSGIVVLGNPDIDVAMGKLKLATGYALLVFLFFLSLAVLLEIANGKIDLSELLEELSGGASLSRFQL